MTTDDPTLAADVYTRALEPHRRGRLRRTAVVAADIVASSLGGLLELSSAGEVVVRRRADDREVLRVPAGPPEEAAQLVAHVEEQLTSMSPAEFREAWGIAQE
ncbi:hypothetical protein [Nocardioides lijunqiniae]|uniref:hypothetical protein n=1 Tax=Nocardioides lijunqiniae TaxID=2760832 RepID=UPI001877FEC0|nr:hypothetical protein [Nocardioides lijunqiniae]